LPALAGVGYTGARPPVRTAADSLEAAMAEVAPGTAPTTRPALPLFYRRVEPLHPERHGKLGVVERGTYALTKMANSVPINAVEFALAARHYPIVFAAEGLAPPAVVLGLRAGENLVVDHEGRWERGLYIPAYVRRYPFIAVSPQGSKEYALCIDAGSDLVVDDGPRALFAEGQPTDLTKRALEFCQTYQSHSELTRQFVEALVANNLLTGRAAKLTLRSGAERALSGFRIIDERKFNALPDAMFLDWRKKGWIALVYAHMASQNCWSGLVDRANRQEVAAKRH
jgi:hypothetical protein